MSRVEDPASGKLKIGDHWNAITIIALSQNNPLKAIAEFVENSIDAGARNVTIVRGKHQGEHYLKIADDGHGIQDFRYVATHIGDSIKRELRRKGEKGLQGEFGIGLLSFWTVGETCTITSAGPDGAARSMKLVKGNPSYAIRDAGALLGRSGTELLIRPILAGVRALSGDKIQNFLASELRDRIAKNGVRIRILDHASRRELVVEPRKFKGRLIHQLPEARSPFGEVYLELYFAEPSGETAVGVYKQGTRVLPDISRLDAFARSPWTSRYIEGIVDAPFLQLTPGTRDGIVLDEAFDSLRIALEPVEDALEALLEERKKAEDEEASRQILHRVTRAFREAYLHLPTEEYGWLAAKTRESRRGGAGDSPDCAGGSGAGGTALVPGEESPLGPGRGDSGADSDGMRSSGSEDTSFGEYLPEPLERPEELQKSFFEYAGPLHKILISPASSVIGVGERRNLRGVARDRRGRTVDSDVSFEWRIFEGSGTLEGTDTAYTEYTAPEEPCIVTIELRAVQGDTLLVANALITVTAELVRRPAGAAALSRRGLPGYTYRRAPGELWRSRYDPEQSVIYINNSHADFVFASRHPMTKVRYIARLFAKELVLANFPEADQEELLERMVELTLYMEENLK
ncbi:MAG TPA: ATP-binding protein [Magnetospirillaceae bacterium]|nr:ATP-binding protein [Magnetospirillaceae bacterium]